MHFWSGFFILSLFGGFLFSFPYLEGFVLVVALDSVAHIVKTR